MKSVLEYQNYREYMQDFYSARKARSGFSWREFARLAGYASPVYLKLVCEGKTNLSDIGIERTAGAMGLAGTELQYFRLLVRFNQERKTALKQNFFRELRAIAKACKVAVVGEDQYDYYQSWRNPVLRELAPAMPGAQASEIASRVLPDTSAADVRKAVRLLEKMGLLVKDDHGALQQTEKSVSTGNLEVASLAVRDMHRQMGTLAVESLDSVPPGERDVSGLTLGLTEKAFDRVVHELEEFRRHVVAIAREDEGMDRIYRLNLQLFPLTRKKEASHE